MNKLKNRIGMTMAELLVVVAIITVLGGVIFIAVWNYQRSLGQLERDGIAKEIFIAAQNHLTAAQGQGYLSKSQYGTAGTFDEDTTETGISDTIKKVYYYVMTNRTASEGGSDVFHLMLPFGSVDETIRTGGSYLIRYQPETATVLDVFYCSTSGSPERFNHDLSTTEYGTVMGLRDDKTGRRTYEAGGNSILGYYGGAEAETLATLKLKAPTIEVINAEKLKVIVTDTNDGTTGAQLQLIVEGVSSNAKKAFPLTTASPGRVKYDNTGSITFCVGLKNGQHWY